MEGVQATLSNQCSINRLCFISYYNMNTPHFRLWFEFDFLNYIVRSICGPCQR